IFVESNHLEEQLHQIILKVELTAEQTRPFTRCLRCNELMVNVAKNELRGRVPDFIYETHGQFNRCPRCDRIYWPGSHTRRSLEKIRQLFNMNRS
ncbi:MAG: Mut7-C RNAse domain-containing protein, partial [Desulfobacterales bacterium]|nr:Mut7-C RNAse domain-containing protein [Desulfobacterales bacterium]